MEKYAKQPTQTDPAEVLSYDQPGKMLEPETVAMFDIPRGSRKIEQQLAALSIFGY